MSGPRLPPEIFDYIIDLLYDQPETLKWCCLVSKSWVPRTRKHLFREIVFEYPCDHLEIWKSTFPDPANMPAHHTRCLTFICSVNSTITLLEEGDYWIQVFRNVAELKFLYVYAGFAPSKPYVHTLICSLPNLEDLTVMALRMSFNNDAIFQPLTSPPLTGTLTVTETQRMEHFVARLLSLPNGIHFRKFRLLWDAEKDVRWVMALVEACSDTLEHVDLEPQVDEPEDMHAASIDFSKATKLKSVVLRVQENSVLWVTRALKTITSGHRDLREVTIHIVFIISAFVDDPVNARRTVTGDQTYALWMGLDRLLVRLSESGAVRVKVRYRLRGRNKEMREYVESLLPEVARGGSNRLLDYSDL